MTRPYGEEMADTSKPVAQALLDLYSGFTPGGGEGINGELLKQIIARMNELGAFRLSQVGEDEFSVDAGVTINAIVYIEWYLIDRIARAEGVDAASVVFDTRQFIDELDD